jgi:hypothetical protein
MNGYDSSLMGAINAMESYQSTFGLSGEGSSTGIVFIIYQCEYFLVSDVETGVETDLQGSRNWTDI